MVLKYVIKRKAGAPAVLELIFYILDGIKASSYNGSIDRVANIFYLISVYHCYSLNSFSGITC